jgi:hypothetical protein
MSSTARYSMYAATRLPYFQQDLKHHVWLSIREARSMEEGSCGCRALMVAPPALHSKFDQEGAPRSSNTAERSVPCQYCGHSHNNANDKASWCFITTDLVSVRRGRQCSASAACCMFEGRLGSTVKVLGRQISLLHMEAAVQVRVRGCMFLRICHRLWPLS